MANLSIQGKMVPGTIYEVKPELNTQTVKDAMAGDGKDQILFEAKGKRYVLEQERIDFKEYKTGSGMPLLHIGETLVQADILHTNNEATSFGEGLGSGVKGALVLGAVGAVVGGFFGGAEGAVGLGALGLAVGGFYAVNVTVSGARSETNDNIMNFVKQPEFNQ